jgi:preprotein translocase subunit SecG
VLGVGGGPTGLMSARGAADFLTRTTTILATAFVATSIALAFVAGANRQADSSVTDILENRPAPAPATSPAPLAPAPTTPALPEVPAAQ